MTIYLADPSPSAVAPSTRARWLAVAAGAVALVLAAFVGYGLHTPHTHVAVGRAYVGIDQASVTVDGWAYGFAVDQNAMTWFDNRGSHEGGTPPCMTDRPGYAWIRFGWSTAHGPDGSSWRAVDWVQCVQHP